MYSFLVTHGAFFNYHWKGRQKPMTTDISPLRLCQECFGAFYHGFHSTDGFSDLPRWLRIEAEGWNGVISKRHCLKVHLNLNYITVLFSICVREDSLLGPQRVVYFARTEYEICRRKRNMHLYSILLYTSLPPFTRRSSMLMAPNGVIC